MLRITIEQNETGPTIKLEGRLVGPWVDEFKTVWQSTRGSEELDNILVDLKGVISIDEKGKALLQQVYQQCGTFVVSGCLTKAIVEEVTADTL